MLIGAPGVGKTTWARAQAGEQLVISPNDHLDGAWTHAKHLTALSAVITTGSDTARGGRGVIFDSTGSTRPLRTAFRNIAQQHQMPLTAVVITAPLNEVLRRNQARHDNTPPEVVARIYRQITARLHEIAQELWSGGIYTDCS